MPVAFFALFVFFCERALYDDFRQREGVVLISVCPDFHLC